MFDVLLLKPLFFIFPSSPDVFSGPRSPMAELQKALTLRGGKDGDGPIKYVFFEFCCCFCAITAAG